MQTNYTKNLSVLLIGTLFISTSGVLGKYIDMPIPAIILCRAFLAAVFLFIYCKIANISLKIKSKKDQKTIFLSGFLIGGHWITYFISLKLSNVSIGMLSLFTYPIITVFLEPFFSKQRINFVHILLGIMVVVGLMTIVPEFSLANDDLKGVLFGVLSAFFFAFRTFIVKEDVKRYDGSMLMFYQVAVVTVLLIPALFFNDFSNAKTQFPYLIMVALVTTCLGHTLVVKSLKYFSASTASIISSVQPIFGIIIAYFTVSEVPNTNTFIGGSLILLTVIIESLRGQKV